jgi:hypothetical protein
MRGIEPPLRAWEARVLPLNYIRKPRARLPKGSLSRNDGSHTPQGHQGANHQQKDDPTAAKLTLHTGRTLPFAMFPPRQSVADQQRQAEAGDEFGKEAIKTKDVDHLARR